MVKIRRSLTGLTFALAACSDPLEFVDARATLHGTVTDHLMLPLPTFVVHYQTIDDVLCAGPVATSQSYTFTNSIGQYSVEVVPGGRCARVIFSSPGRPDLLPDTIHGINLIPGDNVELNVRLQQPAPVIQRNRATLNPGHDLLHIVIPDTVTRGMPFNVAVSHWGSGSCTTPDGMETNRTGNTAVLSPFVLERVTGGCTADQHEFVMTGTITFPEAGPATILVIGRDTTVARTTFVR